MVMYRKAKYQTLNIQAINMVSNFCEKIIINNKFPASTATKHFLPHLQFAS